MSYLWNRLEERRQELIAGKHLFVKDLAKPLGTNEQEHIPEPMVLSNDPEEWSKDQSLIDRIQSAFGVSMIKEMVNWRIGGPLIINSDASWVKGKLIFSWDLSGLIEQEVEYADNDEDSEGIYLKIHPSRYPYVMCALQRYADLETMVLTLTSDQIDSMNVNEIYELTALVCSRKLKEDVPDGTKVDSSTLYRFPNAWLWNWERNPKGFMLTMCKEIGLIEKEIE